MSEYPLYDDVKAADRVMGREVALRPTEAVGAYQFIDTTPLETGRVAAIERGIMQPDGTTVYERVEFAADR
jgi:hypothetical protein